MQSSLAEDETSNHQDPESGTIAANGMTVLD
jgi:hypothetical protein